MKKNPLKQVNLHLSKSSKPKSNLAPGGYSEFNKKESNVGGGASLTANYPQGSTELGVGGIIPIKKNKYFGGAAGINVKQKIPTKWGTFTVKTGLKKGFNKNFNVKDFNFGVSFTKKI